MRRESSFLGFYDGGESYFTHITPFSVWRKGAPHGWTPFQYSDPNASECVAVTAAVVPVPGSADGADLAPTRCWKGRVALDLRYLSQVRFSCRPRQRDQRQQPERLAGAARAEWDVQR